MAKQEIRQRQTQLQQDTTTGNIIENSVSIDDSFLPSPQEIAAYQEVRPDIVDYLLESSKKEQAHRHELDKAKVSIVRKNDRLVFWTNVIGMFFAFLLVVGTLAASVYALTLDRPWFAGIFAAIATIVGSFLVHNKKESK